MCRSGLWIRQMPCTFTSLIARLVKTLPAVQETRVWSLGQEDPPGEGNGNPLQYSCLENPMDRGAWWATVHGVARVRHDLATKQCLFWTDWHLLWLVGIYGILIIKYFEYYLLDRQTQNIIKWKGSGSRWKWSKHVLSCFSHVRLCQWQPTRLLPPWDSPDKSTGVGCHFLLQGDLPDPGIKPTSSVCLVMQVNSLPLSHQRSQWQL